MRQTVVFEKPPIFAEARAKFGPRVDRAIFSWGDRIYNPGRIEITPALFAHEAVHGERQMQADIDAWWRTYLVNPEFRLREEIVAHAAEWRYLSQRGNRHERRAAFAEIAKRLSGPLYGGIVTSTRAKALLIEAAR